MAAVEEHVLVIPRRLFDELGAFQGLRTDTRPYVAALRDARNYQFLARASAEGDPSYKQIIPYFIITHGGRVWCYVRGKRSGEQRLAAKSSIGIGGHINHLDQDLFGDIYARAADRELREEIVVPEGATHRIAALLNDDSNDVGKVHLGIVHVLRSPTGEVRKRESVITEGAFRTPDELRGMRDSLETWSQICLDHLDALLT
jgi:predicted NUDIX family phosphoesterase